MLPTRYQHSASHLFNTSQKYVSTPQMFCANIRIELHTHPTNRFLLSPIHSETAPEGCKDSGCISVLPYLYFFPQTFGTVIRIGEKGWIVHISQKYVTVELFIGIWNVTYQNICTNPPSNPQDSDICNPEDPKS